ncbi:MAG TPA: hypothetical protein VGG72_34405 [Bryobacteraceae bacterium]
MIHRFPTGSMGLASCADLCEVAREKQKRTLWQALKEAFELWPSIEMVPAVCVPPGAHLVWKTVPPDLRRKWNIEEEQPAVFVQTSADVNRYRDALQLACGKTILLQQLREGVRLQIVSTGGGDAGIEGESLLDAFPRTDPVHSY